MFHQTSIFNWLFGVPGDNPKRSKKREFDEFDIPSWELTYPHPLEKYGKIAMFEVSWKSFLVSKSLSQSVTDGNRNPLVWNGLLRKELPKRSCTVPPGDQVAR